MKSISLCETNHGDQSERNKESNRKSTANGGERCERGTSDDDDMPDIEICEVIEKSTNDSKSVIQSRKKSPNVSKHLKILKDDSELSRLNRKYVDKSFADKAVKIFGDKSENDHPKQREKNHSEFSSKVKALEPENQFKNFDILIDIEKNFKEGNNCDTEADFSDLSNGSVKLSELAQLEEKSECLNEVTDNRKKVEKDSDRNGGEVKSDFIISSVNSSVGAMQNGSIANIGGKNCAKNWDAEKTRDQGESYFTEEIFIEDEEEEEEDGNKENMRDCEGVDTSVSHPDKADNAIRKDVENCANENLVNGGIGSDWKADKPEWYIDKAGDPATSEHDHVQGEGSFAENGLLFDEANNEDCEKNLGRIEDVQGNACVNFEDGKDVENEGSVNEKEKIEEDVEINVVDDEEGSELEEQQFQKRKRLSNTEENGEISMKKRKVDGAEKRVNKCNNSSNDHAIQEINVISTRKKNHRSNAVQEKEEIFKKLCSNSNSNNNNKNKANKIDNSNNNNDNDIGSNNNNNNNNNDNNNNNSKSKGKDQSEESISNLDKTINKVAAGKCPLPFVEKLKGNIKALSRKDLEELIVQKLCEVVTERSTIGQLRRKAAALEQDQERWKERVQSLTKQIKEMEMVMKKYMNDIQKYHKDKYCNVAPLRVTRSVGLQVSFMPTNLKASRNAPISTQTINQLAPNIETGTSKLSSQTVNTPTSAKKFVPIAPVPSKISCESKVNSTPKPCVNVAVQNRLVSPPQNCQVRTIISGNRVVQTQLENRTKATPSVQNSKVIDLTEDDDKQNSQNSQKPIFSTGINVKNSGQIRVVNHLQPAQVNPNGRVAYLFPATSANASSSAGSTQSRQVLIATPTVHQPNRQMLPSVPPLLYKGSTLLQPAATQSTFANHSSRVAIVKSLKHPAPLPQPPLNQAHKSSWKLLPPRPALKISKVQTGIVLSWNMTLGPEYEPISSYQLYAYQESNLPPETSLWKKVGDVKALPLPMACTLTQFMTGHRYHFAVRAVDHHSRIGPFSFPGTIVLVK